MKNHTYIILLDVEENSNGRTVLEGFENETFENKNQAIEYINEEGCKDFLIMPISEFMDMVNDEEFIEENWWLGYINILE